MSSEQKIIDKILSDANTECIKILEEANEYADSVITAAEQKAQRELSLEKKLAQAEGEKAAAKEISGAQMQAKKMILSAKQQCLEEVIETAKKSLVDFEPEQYKNIILQMLEKAEKGDEIIFSKKDKNALKEAVESKGFVVSETTRELDGGFIVKKGEIEYNYSFESIIAIQKEEIEQIAAQILFA